MNILALKMFSLSPQLFHQRIKYFPFVHTIGFPRFLSKLIFFIIKYPYLPLEQYSDSFDFSTTRRYQITAIIYLCFALFEDLFRYLWGQLFIHLFEVVKLQQIPQKRRFVICCSLLERFVQYCQDGLRYFDCFFQENSLKIYLGPRTEIVACSF